MGNTNEVIKCMYEDELFAYLPKWAIEDEYDLPDDKLSEIMSSNKGDVVRALGDVFENIGSIDDLLKENADLNENKLRWRKLALCKVYKNRKLTEELEAQKQVNSELANEREALKAEVERLKYNLSVLSSALHGVLLFTEGLDVDDDGVITSSGTGEVLSE